MTPKRVIYALLITTALASCEGGALRKKDCQTCETITSGQGQQTSRIERRVCGKDEVADYITANTIITGNLNVVTRCK